MRLSDVLRLLGVKKHRLVYAHARGKLPIRRQYKWEHHRYSWEEVVRIADYFQVPVPDIESTATTKRTT